MKVYIESYGCTFNKADGQIIAGNLQENNMDIVDSMEEADVIIVNTCYVKLPTENKVTYRIQKLQKEFPDKKIIVGGCMVEIDPEKLDKVAPNASWIGPHQLNKSADVVEATYCGDVVRESGFSKEPKVNVPKVMDDSLVHIIQICEGCLGACTFCCTRFARGPLNSYPIEDIKQEAKRAIENGACEIQLTAQDTAAFGRDSGEKLSDLIKEGTYRFKVKEDTNINFAQITLVKNTIFKITCTPVIAVLSNGFAVTTVVGSCNDPDVNDKKLQVKREGDTVWHDSPYQFVGHTTGIYNFKVRGEEKGTEPKASFQIIGSTDIQVSPSSLSWEAEDYSAQSLDLVTGSSTSWEATVEDS